MEEIIFFLDEEDSEECHESGDFSEEDYDPQLIDKLCEGLRTHF